MGMFSKKHYHFLSASIASTATALDLTRAMDTATYAACRGVLKSLAARLAFELQADNPNFDADKFIKACGFDSVD